MYFFLTLLCLSLVCSPQQQLSHYSLLLHIHSSFILSLSEFTYKMSSSQTLFQRRPAPSHAPAPIPAPANEKNVQSQVTTLDHVIEKTVDKVVDTVVSIQSKPVSRTSRLLLTLSLVSSFLYWTALVHPFSGSLSFSHHHTYAHYFYVIK